LLLAVVWGNEWRPQARFEAECEDAAASVFWQNPPRQPHRAPDARCDCGIYAFKARGEADFLAREKTGAALLAVGRASLWGRIIETERGYRAQYAYPYDLELLGGSADIAGELRASYAVDVSLMPAAIPLHVGSG